MTTKSHFTDSQADAIVALTVVATAVYWVFGA
jgi:hypothetical protein